MLPNPRTPVKGQRHTTNCAKHREARQVLRKHLGTRGKTCQCAFVMQHRRGIQPGPAHSPGFGAALRPEGGPPGLCVPQACVLPCKMG